MGAEALWDLLARLDLDEMSFRLRHKAANETSQQRKQKHLKALKVVESFRDAQKRGENRPEWMIIKILTCYSTRASTFSSIRWRSICNF